jgi:hypothetical protein
MSAHKHAKFLSIAFGPAHWDEPPAEEVTRVYKLLSCELFIAQSV